MKPDWSDAPEWARWLAMSADGSWWWFSDKPTESVGGWWRCDGLFEAAKKYNWKDSVEGRK